MFVFDEDGKNVSLNGFYNTINAIKNQVSFSEINLDILSRQIDFPKYWQKMDGEYEEFRVDPQSEEFRKIFAHFSKTVN